MSDEKKFVAKAKAWTKENNLHGAHAFLKFVILNFVDCLAEDSNEFIFKGGNLLWCYIQTPRQTIDLDLATKNVTEHSVVRTLLEKAAARGRKRGIVFKVIKYVPVKNEAAAAVSVSYKTDDGASNQFEIDVVLKLHAETTSISSSVSPNLEIESASIENIIVDKVDASQTFGSGNTRLKDFDDLWRIMKSDSSVDYKIMKGLFIKRKVILKLDLDWITPEMSDSWTKHIKKYNDLPEKLESLFKDVNDWFASLMR